MHSMHVPKTITIADDVYNELVRIKGNKSFSEVIRELLRQRRGNVDLILKIAGMLSEEEYKEVKKRLKLVNEEFKKWQQSLTQT